MLLDFVPSTEPCAVCLSRGGRVASQRGAHDSEPVCSSLVWQVSENLIVVKHFFHLQANWTQEEAEYVHSVSGVPGHESIRGQTRYVCYLQ